MRADRQTDMLITIVRAPPGGEVTTPARYGMSHRDRDIGGLGKNVFVEFSESVLYPTSIENVVV